MLSRSLSSARGYGHRDDSAWKGTKGTGRRRGAVRRSGQRGRTRGAEAGSGAATIGAGSERAVTQGGTDTAVVGRTDGAERWDGKGGGGVAITFSDDANTRSGWRRVTSPSSYLLASPVSIWLRSLFESTSCGSSLLSTSPSYRRCENATLLVQLGGIPSSAEITSCVRICASCDAVGCGGRCRFGDLGLRGGCIAVLMCSGERETRGWG